MRGKIHQETQVFFYCINICHGSGDLWFAFQFLSDRFFFFKRQPNVDQVSSNEIRALDPIQSSWFSKVYPSLSREGRHVDWNFPLDSISSDQTFLSASNTVISFQFAALLLIDNVFAA